MELRAFAPCHAANTDREGDRAKIARGCRYRRPRQCGTRQTSNIIPAKQRTHAPQCRADTKSKTFSKKLLRRASRVSQHAIDRYLLGERIHPHTRAKLARAVITLEDAKMQKATYLR